MMGASQNTQKLYVPALDGLRFVAFLLVFFHHMPGPPNSVMAFLFARGWVGVDLFFVISAFLFFRLMAEEHRRTATVDVGKFYVRRLLRLYPLMAVFPALMILLYGDGSAKVIGRWLGILTFQDNFLVWLKSYNPIKYSAHLWTLSFEFQVYAVLPFLFLATRSLGVRRSLLMLAAIALAATVARTAFVLSGAPYTAIWVTPFLRPETVLIGMVLALGLCRELRGGYVMIAATAAAVAFWALPNVTVVGPSLVVLYPVVGVLCGSAVWAALYWQPASAFFSMPWLAYLGKISFGLYVYHLLAIGLVRTFAPLEVSSSYWPLLGSSLVLCIALAAVSYHTFESPFARIKRRYEVVSGRPA